jgi:ATP-binding cassette subfamily B protein
MRTDYGYFEEKQLGKAYDFKLLRRLYPFARPFAGLLLWSIVLVIWITLLDLSIPYVTKVAIDRYIVPQIERNGRQSDQTGELPQRFLPVDPKDPEVGRIVSRYPDLFRRQGSTTQISIEAISRLEENEIAALRKRDLGGLARISAIFLFIIVLNFIFNFVQKVIMEYTGHMIMHKLRLQLFTHIQTLSIEFFTRNPVGRLVTRVTNDVQNMHELFTALLAFIFKDLFLLFGIATVLIVLNWKLALATFAVIPVVFYASIIFAHKARDVFRMLRIKIAEINTRFSETISGIKVIQLFDHEEQNFREFKQLNHENYLAGMRQIRILGIFLPAIEP